MDEKLRTFYLESQVKNASRGQLLVMLYDGLIEHAERADAEMTAPENPQDQCQAARCVSRCIDIMTELNTCLNHSVDPVLCGKLSDLYLFFTREFSDAFEKREPRRIRAILPLIRNLRNTWSEADRRAGQMQLAAA